LPMTDKERTHERYDIPNADVLFEDTWAEDEVGAVCPACRRRVPGGREVCPACGVALEACGRSCASCGLKTCVGGQSRESSTR